MEYIMNSTYNSHHNLPVKIKQALTRTSMQRSTLHYTVCFCRT